ncbi:MAG: peptidoglycan-binding protein [Leptolyngbyaceae cyanobacterium MO_188.B28]|nr:peptidoglycan-binding protein [Leptolyngbyaceae cyanobacterium MO_188.B28]
MMSTHPESNLLPSTAIPSALEVNSILQQGDQGGDVIRLQQLLNAKGANLRVDGVFSHHTKATVIQFQKTHGLKANGLVDAITRQALLQPEVQVLLTTVAENYDPQENLHQVRALEWFQHEIPASTLIEFYRRWRDQIPMPEPMLYPGDQGKAVIELQKLLHDKETLLTITERSISGVFDPLTKIAVSRFQQQRGLMADGIVGPLTWRELRRPPKPILLANLLDDYSPIDCPYQMAALMWLQNQISDTILTEFSLRWRHREV